MDVKFTIKIKGKNVPTFKKELGKGVLEIRVVDFIEAEMKDLKSPMFQKAIHEYGEELVKEWIEVNMEVVKPKKTKKK